MTFGEVGGYRMSKTNDSVELLKRNNVIRILAISLVFAMILSSITILVGVPPASDPLAHASYTAHGPIYISGNGGFTNGSGVIWGSGTASDPYIIEGWEIDSTGFLVGINIGNTTAHFVIRDCLVYNGGQLDILLDNVTNGRLLRDECTSTQVGYGIYLRNSDHCLIENVNSSANSHHGLYLYYSDNNTAYNSTFSDSASGNGILLSNSRDNNLVNNSCLRNNNNGIWLYTSSDDNALINNNCSSNTNDGISLWASSNNIISNNTCNWNNHYLGIVLNSSSNNNIISNNTCSNNAGEGIYLVSSNGNTVTNNSCPNNDYNSIEIDYSNNNIISSNNCTSNTYYGIALQGSSGNTIINNTCGSNGWEGLYLVISSDNNIISNNTFSNNRYGVYIFSGSNNNVIWNNTFIGNNGAGNVYDPSHIQARDSGTNNRWNSTNGHGNHWADWTIPDHNFDGVVDNPYNISGSSGAEDYYPLTGVSRSSHSPISINNDTEFNNTLYPLNGVVSGNGSLSNPYIIEGWGINSTGFPVGIYIGNTTLHFIIQDCTVFAADENDIEFYNLTGGTILRVSCSLAQSGSGIFIDSSNNCKVDAVYCSSNSLHGLYLYGSMDNLICNSDFSNTFTGVGAGVSLYSSPFNTIQNVSCTGFHDGIYIEYSSSVIVENASVYHNIAHGILLNYADYNEIRYCNITNNGVEGIYVRYSSFNIIHRNILMDNADHGVHMSFGPPDPTQNKVWNNTFIRNNGAIMDTYDSAHIQAQDNGVANYWNTVGTPHGYGNMWGDMRGPDSNLDGIVDVPYYIPGGAGSQDNYPLALWVPAPIDTSIYINNDPEFASMAASKGWPGDGTSGDPYIIDGYHISATVYPFAIYIGNTTVHFVVSNCTLSNNISSGNEVSAGIVLYNVINGRLTENNCSSNQVGIWLMYSDYNMIENNSCMDDFYGIALMTSSHNTLVSNSCPLNIGFGIFLFESSNSNLLIKNTCRSNNGSGISLYSMCNNNVIDNNTCTFSTTLDGITLGLSSNFNLITENNCSSNYFFGIDLLYSSNQNVISSNRLFDNRGYGIAIVSTNDTGNRVIGNIFIGNNGAGAVYDVYYAQAYDDGMNNWWNSSTGYGNYWSDWTTPDSIAPFGIVDLSYEISGGAFSTDCYPLTALPGSPDIYPPMTTLSLSGTLGTNGWYVSSVIITLTSMDAMSGVNGTVYCLNESGSWSAASSVMSFTQEGYCTIEYYSVDIVGNAETVKNATIRIDTISPDSEAVSNGARVTISSSDLTSGVDETFYRIDGGSWQGYTGSFDVMSGDHTVEYYSIDVAGNVEAQKSIVANGSAFLGIDLLGLILISAAIIIAMLIIVIIMVMRRNRRASEVRAAYHASQAGYYPTGATSEMQTGAPSVTAQPPVAPQPPIMPAVTIRCPFCGLTNEAKWLFCGSCGAKLR